MATMATATAIIPTMATATGEGRRGTKAIRSQVDHHDDIQVCGC